MEALTSPLLKTPARHDPDVPAKDAAIATLIDLARHRRAENIVIGSGRTAHAIETGRLVEVAWDRLGGQTLRVVTWPEAGASWLRHAPRFTAYCQRSLNSDDTAPEGCSVDHGRINIVMRRAMTGRMARWTKT